MERRGLRDQRPIVGRIESTNRRFQHLVELATQDLRRSWDLWAVGKHQQESLRIGRGHRQGCFGLDGGLDLPSWRRSQQVQMRPVNLINETRDREEPETRLLQ